MIVGFTMSAVLKVEVNDSGSVVQVEPDSVRRPKTAIGGTRSPVVKMKKVVIISRTTFIYLKICFD